MRGDDRQRGHAHAASLAFFNQRDAGHQRLIAWKARAHLLQKGLIYLEDDLQMARQQALKAAAEKLSAYLQARFPGYRYRPTPDFLVSHKLVDTGENVEYVLDNPEAPKMVRHKLTVELRDLQLARLLDEDRREHSAERLEVAGRGLAGLVLILVALVGYVRLDDWTRGYFSTFLKFTALALAVGGAALLWYLI